MPRSDRPCPTTSGPYVCTVGASGHSGPCETTEQAPPWIGPALQPGDVRTAVATIRRRHAVELYEAERRVRRAELRAHAAKTLSESPSAPSDGPTVVPDGIDPKNITGNHFHGPSHG